MCAIVKPNPWSAEYAMFTSVGKVDKSAASQRAANIQTARPI